MRLIGYLHQGARHIGAVRNGKVVPLGSIAEFYRDPGAALRSADGVTTTIDLADCETAPFVPETARIFCVGINYLDHADESKSVANIDLPKFPMIFGRWQDTLVTDGTPVPVPANEGLDWEVELAVVIGTEAWEADENTAMDHVLGYTAFNDLSARKKQLQTRQFTLGKNADRSGPIGPVLVTADEIPDPHDLQVSCRVNGETMQSASTRDLIHRIPALITYITDTVTLRPGDVIATGTPGGVGNAFDPPRFLGPGDEVEVEVESIGVVRTPIVHRSALVGTTT